jgi:beta-lactamase class A
MRGRKLYRYIVGVMRILAIVALIMTGLGTGFRASSAPLQSQIAALAKQFDGEAGLYARNLASGEEIAFNAHTRFPTASTIKTAVMLEAYHQAAEGKLRFDETVALTEAMKVGGAGILNGLRPGLQLRVSDLVHLMIVLSDNTATNILVERLGTKQIDERLPGYKLHNTKIFRPTFRDGRADVFPELEREFGLGMTTPREMADLMALIAEGRAVNAEASASMLATLRRQTDKGMIPRLLPAGVEVGNKTGTDSEKLPDAKGRRGSIRADAAIVTSPGLKYVVTIYTRRGGDTTSGIDNAALILGARLSRVVFDAFRAR